MAEPTGPADRANLPLLTRITQESLDVDYEVAARRRAARGVEARPGRQRRTAAVVVGVFGLLVAIAAVQTSARAGVESASRDSLIKQVQTGRADVGDLQDRIVRLRELNVGLQDSYDEADTSADATQEKATRLAAQSGFGAVTGPGVQITVDDASSGEKVRDSDLGILVDGLWNAGAEAIAINGQRLTNRSAIRNSSTAIRVNAQPLLRPYVVSAIGDERTLQSDLMNTDSGLEFRNLADALGLEWSMDDADKLTLPAAPARLLKLRWATEGTAKGNLKQHEKETP